MPAFDYPVKGQPRPRPSEVPVEHVKLALRKYGPYLLIEALMPGGTLIALTLWLFNRARTAR